MEGVQIVVAPTLGADDKPYIILGFHNAYFSQSVYLPYNNRTDIDALIAHLGESLTKACDVIESQNAVQDSEKRK